MHKVIVEFPGVLKVHKLSYKKHGLVLHYYHHQSGKRWFTLMQL